MPPIICEIFTLNITGGLDLILTETLNYNLMAKPTYRCFPSEDISVKAQVVFCHI